MLRTQIYLPEELRRKIDAARRWSGKSLSDYLREAAEEKTAKDKKEKEKYKKLAKDFMEFAKNNPRTKESAEAWVKEVREDRRKEDEHWLKRWDEAISKK